MKSEEEFDKQIAKDLEREIKATMKRVTDAHNKAAKKGPLKSDAYSRMKKEGLWKARFIISEYMVIKKSNSKLPSELRKMIIMIFSTASTNLWAKRIYTKNKTKADENEKRR